jgi:hypothetical protein
MRYQKLHRGEKPNIRRQAEEREKALKDDSDNGGVEFDLALLTLQNETTTLSVFLSM